MPDIKTGNSSHDKTCFTALQTRAAAMDAAGSTASQATVNAVEVTYYRALKASAIANGLTEGVVEFTQALRDLRATP
jgi:hypothetical protein